jgi:adenine-specific DNA-methyltransferase
MEGYSQTPKEERLKRLKAIFPEVFDEGKIDWEKLKATLGESCKFFQRTLCAQLGWKKRSFSDIAAAYIRDLGTCKK